MKGSIAVLCLLLSAAAIAQNSTADKKQLNTLQTQYQAAKTSYKKLKSPKTKMALVVATDKLATATMTSEVLDARLRYPMSLGLYQEALVLDPSNNEAKNNASMIDSVYKGMIAKAKATLAKNPHDATASAQLSRLTGIYKKIHRPLP